MAYDLVICGGLVVDGSGRQAFGADVGVKDGRIVEVGRIEPDEGAREIDASGLVAAPGGPGRAGAPRFEPRQPPLL